MDRLQRNGGTFGILAGVALALLFAAFATSGITPDTFGDPAKALPVIREQAARLKLIGLFGTRPNVARLLGLAARAAASEGGPPPEVAQEIPKVQARLKVLARIALVLIAVAVLAMATARYW